MWPAGQAVIDRLAVRVSGQAAGADATAGVRLRISQLMGTADLRPPGLDPSAVLIVRRLADPLPGRMVPDLSAVRVDPAWDAALRSALADLWRRAARPARGPVPAGADAVLFADAAELLACLALDLVRGEAPQRWWWHSVLRTLPLPARSDPGALLEIRPRYLPAVLQHLAARGELAAVMAAVAPAGALRLLAAMAGAFDLPAADLLPPPAAPAPAASDPLPGDGPAAAGAAGADESVAQTPVARGRPGDTGPRTGAAAAPGRRGPVAPPWEPIAGPSPLPPGAPPAAQALVGVGLALSRSPGAVGGSAFRVRLRAWWAATAAPPPAQAAAVPGDPLPQQAAAGAAPATAPAGPGRRAGTTPPDHAPAAPPLAAAGQPDPLLGRGAGPPGPGAADGAGPAAAAAAAAAAPPACPPAQPDAAAPAAAPDGSPAGPAPGTPNAALPAAGAADMAPPVAAADALPAAAGPAALAGGVATAVGGVLYLINLMRQLDLPGCFEPDWGLASGVGAWGVLDALGRALLGRAGAGLGSDPLWAALAVLDNRPPGELPGAGYTGRGPLRLPATWPPEPGRRPPRGRPRPRPRLPAAPLLAGGNPHLAAWLALTLPYIRHRLTRMLKLPPNAPAAHLPLLTPHYGNLHVTQSHVDLVLPLAAISLPARLAGLDRDPGWVPGLGRVVLFHYE